MRHRLGRGDRGQARAIPAAERAAGSGQHDPAHALGLARTQALEHRAVLAVDRHDLRAGGAGGGDHQFAGQHQRFLVGQQQALAGARGGQGRGQPGGADDRRHHGVALRAGDQAFQRRVAGVGTGGQPGGGQAIAQCRVGVRVGDHRMVGAVPRAQGEQGIDLAAGGQHAGPHPPGMARDHIQRRGADRAGGAEHGDLADVGGGGHGRAVRAQKPRISLPTTNTGTAASTPSMRSRMPPWPGIR